MDTLLALPPPAATTLPRPTSAMASGLGDFEKIGEGKYREIYRVGRHALKVLKYYRVKERLGISLRIPLAHYTQRRFGIADFNVTERENFLALRVELRTSLADLLAPIHWVGSYFGRSVSLSDLVVNFDGSPAQPLAKFKNVADQSFWLRLGQLEQFFLEKKFYFIDITGENILVRVGQHALHPVFIDYKRLGPGTYPCQFWLASEKILAWKMRKRFQRLRDQFKPR